MRTKMQHNGLPHLVLPAATLCAIFANATEPQSPPKHLKRSLGARQVEIAVIASIAGCAPTTSDPIARKFSGTAFCAVETRPVARISIHKLSSLNSFVRNN